VLLLKKLSKIIGREANKVIENTKNTIKDDKHKGGEGGQQQQAEQEEEEVADTKASNLAKTSEELSEIILTERMNLNERLAQQARTESGIDCEAVEVNSLAVENGPYYSYKYPLSPRIVTNRGCIRVKDKRFSLIQIVQRN
jgi:hypothetical protein